MSNAYRTLRPDEVWRCVEGGYEFFEEAKLPGKFIPDRFTENWRNLIANKRGAIIGLFKDDEIIGALGMVLAPDLNNCDIIATECFWFVRPKFRKGTAAIKLLTAFEDLSKQIGAVHCAMIHLENINAGPLEKLYDRRGYRLVERHYLKTL